MLSIPWIQRNSPQILLRSTRQLLPEVATATATATTRTVTTTKATFPQESILTHGCSHDCARSGKTRKIKTRTPTCFNHLFPTRAFTSLPTTLSSVNHNYQHRYHQHQKVRTHYSYSGPGRFSSWKPERTNWYERGYTVGIGGPVGSGKTALVLQLTRALQDTTSKYSNLLPPIGVVTNDIFTQEDAEFLTKHQALPPELIRAVETGGCPHAAIREDVSANLTACEELTQLLVEKQSASSTSLPPLILCESGGDNLAANFSSELADLTLYVIDVAGGDKVPRKGGPGITQSDLLIVNKIDLAVAVGANLDVMKQDANKMRQHPQHLMQDPTHSHYSHSHSHDHSRGHSHSHEEEEMPLPSSSFGPTIFASVKQGAGMEEIIAFLLESYYKATGTNSPK